MNSMNPRRTAITDNGLNEGSTDGSKLDSILDMVMAQCRKGRPVELEKLIASHPELERELRQAVPALIALEQSGTATVTSLKVGAPHEVLQGNRTLGDFKLIREVGRGGMGVVYEAEQISLGRRVALKVLPMAGLLDERQLHRFKNEARAAASLHHPNIVPVYSVGIENAVHFYAMQLIEGKTLAEFIRQTAPVKLAKEPTVNRSSVFQRLQGSLATLLGPLPPAHVDDQPPMVDAPKPDRARDGQPEDKCTVDKAAAAETVEVARSMTQGSLRSNGYFRLISELGIQVAEALEYAHSLGIVHRDIKPSNLLLDGSGKVWVADFGLAHIEADAGMTMSGDLMGTLRYMSPEQTLGQRGMVDGRADIYSLGISLYELLTACPAFPTTNRQKLLRQLVEQEPVKPRQLNPAIPKDLETIVLKAIAKDPQQRYATAQELADDLRRLLQHQPVRAKRPTVFDQSHKWLRRHPSMVAASILVLLTTSITLALSTVLISAAYEQEGNERLRAEQAVKAEQRQRLTAEALREEADEQRAIAQENFNDALAAVDQMLVRVSERRLNEIPQMQSVRRDLMSDAAEFYSRFVGRRSGDSKLRFTAARAITQLGEVLHTIQEDKQAEAYYHQALEMVAGRDEKYGRLASEVSHLRVHLHLQLAFAVKDQGRLPETLMIFRSALELAREQTKRFPSERSREDLIKSLQVLGDYYIYSAKDRDLKEAEKLGREAVGLKPTFRGLGVLGHALLNQGRLEESRPVLRQAAELPQDPWTEVYSSLARLEEEAGNANAAIDLHRKAIQFLQAHLQKNAGDLTAARRWKRSLDRLFLLLRQLDLPNEIEAQSYATLDFCIEVFQNPLSASLPRENVKLFNELQRQIYVSQLSLQAAEQRARRDFRERPTDRYAFFLACVLIRKGDASEARAILNTLREDLHEPGEFMKLAELELRHSNPDAAIADFRSAIDLLEDRLRQQPDQYSVVQWRDVVERVLGLLSSPEQVNLRRAIFDESMSVLAEVLEEPEGKLITYQLWEARARIVALLTDAELPASERHMQVIQAYENAMKGTDERFHMRKRIAWCYYDLQMYDQALEHLQRAVELNPRDLTILTWKGIDVITACPDDSFIAGLLSLADQATELSGGNDAVEATKISLLFAAAHRCQNKGLPETEMFARQAFELAVKLARATADVNSSTLGEALHYARPTLELLLNELRIQGRLEEAEQHARGAITFCRELGGEGKNANLQRELLGHSLWHLSDILRETNRSVEADVVASDATRVLSR